MTRNYILHCIFANYKVAFILKCHLDVEKIILTLGSSLDGILDLVTLIITLPGSRMDDFQDGVIFDHLSSMNSPG